MPLPEINWRFGSDSPDDEQDTDGHESLAAFSGPSHEALSKLAAASTQELDIMDDDLVNQEDPYLQDLLGPLADD